MRALPNTSAPEAIPGRIAGVVHVLLPFPQGVMVMGEFGGIKGEGGFGDMPARNIAWFQNDVGWRGPNSPLDLISIRAALPVAEGLLLGGEGGLRLLTHRMGPTSEMLRALHSGSTPLLPAGSGALQLAGKSGGKSGGVLMLSGQESASLQLLARPSVGFEPVPARPIPNCFRSADWECVALVNHEGRVYAAFNHHPGGSRLRMGSVQGGLDGIVIGFFLPGAPRDPSVVLVWDPKALTWSMVGQPFKSGIHHQIRSLVSTPHGLVAVTARAVQLYKPEKNTWAVVVKVEEDPEFNCAFPLPDGRIAVGHEIHISGPGIPDRQPLVVAYDLHGGDPAPIGPYSSSGHAVSALAQVGDTLWVGGGWRNVSGACSFVGRDFQRGVEFPFSKELGHETGCVSVFGVGVDADGNPLVAMAVVTDSDQDFGLRWTEAQIRILGPS